MKQVMSVAIMIVMNGAMMIAPHAYHPNDNQEFHHLSKVFLFFFAYFIYGNVTIGTEKVNL